MFCDRFFRQQAGIVLFVAMVMVLILAALTVTTAQVTGMSAKFAQFSSRGTKSFLQQQSVLAAMKREIVTNVAGGGRYDYFPQHGMSEDVVSFSSAGQNMSLIYMGLKEGEDAEDVPFYGVGDSGNANLRCVPKGARTTIYYNDGSVNGDSVPVPYDLTGYCFINLEPTTSQVYAGSGMREVIQDKIPRPAFAAYRQRLNSNGGLRITSPGSDDESAAFKWAWEAMDWPAYPAGRCGGAISPCFTPGSIGLNDTLLAKNANAMYTQSIDNGGADFGIFAEGAYNSNKTGSSYTLSQSVVNDNFTGDRAASSGDNDSFIPRYMIEVGYYDNGIGMSDTNPKIFRVRVTSSGYGGFTGEQNGVVINRPGARVTYKTIIEVSDK